MIDYPLVEVRWKDSYTSDYLDLSENNEVIDSYLESIKVGFLIKENKECLVIADLFYPATKVAKRYTVIPKEVVIKKIILFSGDDS